MRCWVCKKEEARKFICGEICFEMRDEEGCEKRGLRVRIFIRLCR